MALYAYLLPAGGGSVGTGCTQVAGLDGCCLPLLSYCRTGFGGLVGARLGRVSSREAPWYGPALLPQAGVAVGMALVAGERFPDWSSAIMAFTIASTVVFELVGPPITLAAIRKVSS